MQRMRWILAAAMLVISVSNEAVGLVGAMPPGPMPLCGVTVSAVDNMPAVVDVLSYLSHTPTVHVVFGEGMDALHYVGRVATIRDVAYIMGELTDSPALKQYTTPQLRQRAAAYLHTLTGNIDVQEINNEVNGEWTGPTREVINKAMAAYETIEAGGDRTALTLYYNKSCARQPSRAVSDWAQRNVPLRLHDGLDYVFISFYKDDYKTTPPDWNTVFTRLGELSPHAVLGFGGVGTRHTMRKAASVAHYYGLAVAHPRFVGRYFWWYFRQDMVPCSRPLWHSLGAAFLSMPAVVNRQPARSHAECQRVNGR